MCRQIFIWHRACEHSSINEERCDQTLSPFSTPLFCDKYQTVRLSTNTARCRGLYCKDEPGGKWSERGAPQVAQLSLDVQDLKDLIGARELECQFVIQRWYRGGPLQQAREEEHYVRLQEELTELRLKKYELQLNISAIEDSHNPAKNTKGFDPALYQAEFLKKKKNILTAAASRKNASIPLPTLGIPRFTPFVKMPDTSDNSALLIPRLDSNRGTLKGYVAAIEPINDSGIFTSWPSHHIPLNHAAPNESSNNADVSPELATADILVADEQMDVTPQSPTTRRTRSYIAQPRLTEAASHLRPRPRDTGSKRRSARQTSVEDITSSGTRRSGRLSGKGRKNYAESSSDETSFSPSQTNLRQPASQNSRGTSVSNGSKRRKTAEDLDDDFNGDDEGRIFALDPQDDEDCGVSEATPSKRPSIDGWHSPSVLLEGLSGGCKTSEVTSLQVAQKPSGLLSNPRILDALQKLRAQPDTAPTESPQSCKYGIAPMAPMYMPSPTILLRGAPGLDVVVQPPLSLPAISRGARYVPVGSHINPQQANKLSPQTVLSGREDEPIGSDHITASPRSTFPIVGAQLPRSAFLVAPQYHDSHGTIASQDNNHYMGRMAGVGIPQIFLGQSDIQQPTEQSGMPDPFGLNVSELNGESFEDINFDDMINFGGDEV